MEDLLRIYREVLSISKENDNMTPDEEAEFLKSLGIDEDTLRDIGHLGYHRKNHIPRFD